MSAQARRLWDHGQGVDPLIHAFTVGDDPYWDLRLIRWDCLASAAHGRTLQRAELLTVAEADALVLALRDIARAAQRGEFPIPQELEDGHTAIEVELTRRCGAAGAKIHTGRSRNDQVATAMRLCLRDGLLRWADALDSFARVTLDRMERDGAIPLPGYTHLQPAMPSSVGQWLHAVIEATLEQWQIALDLLDRIDACPLGSGAGYGVPVRLDRRYTAELLGFAHPQRSVVDVQNSRGRYEAWCARIGADVGRVLERLSADVILMATREFGFVRLPSAIATGSSIMPQKRNPDIFELLRAHAVRLRSWLAGIEGLTAHLTSGYHRDLQLTKEPTLRCLEAVPRMLEVAGRALAAIEFDAERCAAAVSGELFAAHEALARAEAGQPFREAYRAVASEIASGTFAPSPAARAANPAQFVSAEVRQELSTDCDSLRQRAEKWRERLRRVEVSVFG